MKQTEGRATREESESDKELLNYSLIKRETHFVKSKHTQPSLSHTLKHGHTNILLNAKQPRINLLNG